jgi:deoxyribose-phosphate aldolase
MNYTYADISKMLDHSLLNPTMTTADFETGCKLAAAYDCASVCIMPYYLKRCVEILAGTTVQPSTVIGFPHGGHLTATKVFEAKQAIADGARELDMVSNISKTLSGDWDYVRRDIKELVDCCHAAGVKLKVIFENCFLKDEHKIRLCEICSELGVDWVKTSTGYGTGGATLDDLRLMRKHSAPQVQVKAAGGVRDVDTLLAVREIGVTRVGSSISGKMLDEVRNRLGLAPVAGYGEAKGGSY